MWYYQYEDFELFIKPDSRGRFTLWINGVPYGSFCKPDDAAVNVGCFVTDCAEWDALADQAVSVPSDLSGWSAITVK